MENSYTKKYAVHYKSESDNRVYFTVYPIFKENENKILYRDREDDQGYTEWKDGKCFVKMEGSLCWRGVWEDRYYMVDDEYWYGELKELSDLYTDIIEPYCKEYIRSKDPDIYE